MKQLILRREEERFNRNHPYEIYVSGVRAGSLQNGDSEVLTVDPDAESFEVRLLWCGSGKVVFDGDAEEELFEVRGNRFLNQRMAYFGVIVPLVALLLTWAGLGKELVVPVLGIFILFIIGTLTVGRNRWIQVRRI